ncbi:L-histidine N(alpha)-methyltransferase [Methylocaldum sp. 14B]|uniref:L-histidine N(alpha)-methyltransferase n=1 Tax=Methylocaldum sp. 14B TaxID=1912213 RepID=UPI000989E8BC|nr:L-histidine N(alpha)-methyltransferase [Methylocaldum sp. 14B]
MTARRIRFTDREPAQADILDEVLSGLFSPKKRLPPKLFYDKRGSELFEAICETPEYYPTRTEVGILRDSAQEIAETIGKDCILIEPGSGNSQKVQLLLETLHPAVYMPMDISKDHLKLSVQALGAAYPWLRVHAMCMDYTAGLEPFEPPPASAESKKVVFFPGSTIGNFEPGEALAFLRRVARLVEPDGGLLIGVDLKKDPAVLHRAYNDAQGLTREFNLNVLHRLNTELDADFDPGRFYHYAFYNVRESRIEMHLISRGAQEIRLAGEFLTFADGESVHTENSYKYTVEEFQRLARTAGFRVRGCWLDDCNLFSIHYFDLPS